MDKKIALITGGSRGLGKNAVLKLAERGVDVILTYHSREAEADAVVAQAKRFGRKSAAFSLDVGKSATFAAFAEQVRAELEACYL
jgi:NAD(P)-dependent dehydrogenase (short-subunit alcohol dehydrogenase family)